MQCINFRLTFAGVSVSVFIFFFLGGSCMSPSTIRREDLFSEEQQCMKNENLSS